MINKLKGATCDLHHLLICASNFNILRLTGSKKILAKSKMVSLQKLKCQHNTKPIPGSYYLSLVSTPVSFRYTIPLSRIQQNKLYEPIPFHAHL